MKTYAEKLKDPRWQKKRLQILERDGFKCAQCCDENTTLHIHHVAYTKGDPWLINNDLLTTLCEDCHNHETAELALLYKTLVNELRSCGLIARMIESVPAIFQDVNRGWEGYDPAIDIIKMAVQDDHIWNFLHNEYFERLRLRQQ